VKLQLKGARFDAIEGIQKAMTDQLNKISAEDFSNAMKKLETCANLCITSNGSYKQKKKNTFFFFTPLVRELMDHTV
jgi:hypothetical protein